MISQHSVHGPGLLGEFTDAQAALLGQCFPGSVLHVEEDLEVPLRTDCVLPTGAPVSPPAHLDTMSVLAAASGALLVTVKQHRRVPGAQRDGEPHALQAVSWRFADG